MPIDPSTAEAWSALGSIAAVMDWDWEAVDAHFRRALNLSLTDAMAAYAAFLAFQGRLAESREMIDRAMAADPLSLVVRSQRALTAAFGGDTEMAIRLHRDVLEIEPRFARAHWALGIALSRTGRFEEALSHYESARAAIGDAPFLLGWHGHCLALAGRQEEALAIQQQLTRMAATRFVPAFAHAMMRMGAGDLEGALDGFGKACDERTGWMLELKMSRSFAPLHGHPRYDALLRRMHLDAR